MFFVRKHRSWAQASLSCRLATLLLAGMAAGVPSSVSRINLFHYKKVMAVLAELLEKLVGVPDDLASDLDEVKQRRAEAVAQLGGFFIVHRRHCDTQRRLAYEAEAVESHGRQPRTRAFVFRFPLGRSSIPMSLLSSLWNCSMVPWSRYRAAHWRTEYGRLVHQLLNSTGGISSASPLARIDRRSS